MVSLFRQRPGTGAVGAKLVYPDGSLQEAGGIIWQDASGWNFGRLEEPSKPAYNYVREVDYCSAAALMVERQVFANLGGFDSMYAPAYFEDADLCFRLRRIGLKTLYQPAARVVHHEGMSHGRDTSVGIKSYQVANRAAFISRGPVSSRTSTSAMATIFFVPATGPCTATLSWSSTITSRRPIAMPGRA